MNPTSRIRSVLFWLGLGIVTFADLVLGYGSGFWSLAAGLSRPARSACAGPRRDLPYT